MRQALSARHDHRNKMERKLTVLVVVLMSLGHGAFGQSSTSFCIRSEEISTGFEKLEANRSAATSNLISSHQPLFDNLVRLATEYVLNLETKTQEDLDNIFGAEALVEYKRALDYSLDSIPFALRKSCDGLETTRISVHNGVAAGVATAGPVVRLALAGNYPINRVAIETYHVQLSAGVASWVRAIYDLLRTCLNTTDIDTLAVIKTAEDGSVAGIQRAVNAFFDVIKLLNVAITTGNKNFTLINDIEECRARLNVALRDEVNYKFGLFEGFYANYCSQQTGLLSDLVAIQYASIVTSQTTDMIVPAFVNEIIYRVNRIRFGFSDDGENLMARTNVARVIITNQVTTAVDLCLDLLVKLYPEDSTAIKNAQTPMHDFMQQIVLTGVRFIVAASDQSKTYLEIKADMDITNIEVRGLMGKFAETIIAVLSDDRISSPEVKSEFSAITSQAIVYGDNYIRITQNQADILAKFSAKDGTGVTDVDSAIQAAESEGHFTIINYINSWFVALRFLFFVGHSSSTIVQPPIQL